VFIASEPAPLREVGKRTSYVTALTIVGIGGCFYSKDRLIVELARVTSTLRALILSFDPMSRLKT
jgi:hypothetical protein